MAIEMHQIGQYIDLLNSKPGIQACATRHVCRMSPQRQIGQLTIATYVEPSVRRARPPVGVQSTEEQLLQTTTV